MHLNCKCVYVDGIELKVTPLAPPAPTVVVAIDSNEPKDFPENCEATVPNIGTIASSL